MKYRVRKYKVNKIYNLLCPKFPAEVLKLTFGCVKNFLSFIYLQCLLLLHNYSGPLVPTNLNSGSDVFL